jgi:hypothetical protein
MVGRPKKIIKEEVKEEPIIEELVIDAMSTPEPIVEIPVEPIPIPTPVIPPKPVYGTERLLSGSAVSTPRLPDVIGGVCSYCGPGKFDAKASGHPKMIEDLTVDPVTQIGRCEHYSGVQVRCSYCPDSANFAENVKHRRHVVHVSPYDPNKLIFVCDDQACATKHIQKFTA